MVMGKTTTKPWDPNEHISSKAEMAAYLEAALEDGDPSVIAGVLGDIARSKGMAQLARDTGLGRESLYKSLSSEGNPEFSTILKGVNALWLKLQATPDTGDESVWVSMSRSNHTLQQKLDRFLPALRLRSVAVKHC